MVQKTHDVNPVQLHSKQLPAAACRCARRRRTPPFRWLTPALLLAWMLSHPAISAADDARLAFFESRIRPVLVRSCYKCHSRQSDPLQAELRLDVRLTKAAALISPGKPDASRIIQAIRYTDSELQMPPDGRLDPAVIADFETWIRMGAVDPRPALTDPPAIAHPQALDLEAGRRFWAFQP